MSRASGEGGAGAGIGRSPAIRLRYLLLAITVFGGSFIIFTTSRNMNIVFIDHRPSNAIQVHQYDHNEKAYTIRTEGCSIPAMEPLSAAVQKYVKSPKEIKCFNASFNILASDRRKIWVTRENLPMYRVEKKEKSLICCYQAFYRPKTIVDITSSGVDSRVKYDDCKYFNENIDIQDEFVRVKCSVKNETIYQQYFLSAPKKKFMKHDGHEQKYNDDPDYNVLVLGIDGVSRLNLHRTMPKTTSLLKSKGALEMLGYNKVADNTFPNLIPVVLGIAKNQLRKVCLPHEKATFDNCPFIWEWFKQAGFYTALGEDTSNLGTFNYVKMGFSNTPTDYYLHTFMHEVEKYVGYNKDIYSYLCMRDKFMYKVLLDYIEDLTTTLKNSKLFGFFWEISMSHDHLNYPMVMDDDYVTFFNRLEASGYLNKTIVFLVSDHGIRWGGIRATAQGRLEERLPFLFVLTPPSFRETYTKAYDHLKLNTKRLTTPFDLYETMSHLIDLKSITDESLLSRMKTNYSKNRGISLFLPVPANRTCAAADITDHWCTCRKDVFVPKDSPIALEAALNLITLLNEMLAEYPQCARLSISEVLEATMMKPANSNKSEVGWREYMVVLRTEPGGGIFEATLRKENGKWSLLGTASRLNLYGEQSRCVNHPQLKLYCFCR